jgi:hypothetical protein
MVFVTIAIHTVLEKLSTKAQTELFTKPETLVKIVMEAQEAGCLECPYKLR